MPEWWTYTLADFLLFSPRTYYRLLERYNQAVWPAQLPLVAAGLFIVGSVRYPRPWHGRVFFALLALIWAWIAAAFLWRRYTNINWAAGYLVPLFGMEALLLIWSGVLRRELELRASHGLRSVLGIALLVLSVLIYPVLAPSAGRSFWTAEVFGLAPDPSAIATLGLMLLSSRTRWTLLVIPLLWCLFSGLTLWALGSPEAWVVGMAGVLTIVASARSPGSGPSSTAADVRAA